MHIDSIYLSVDSEYYSHGEGIINMYLNDKKHLIIAKIDYPDSTRILQLNETVLVEIKKIISDSIIYDSFKSIENTDLNFGFNGMEFDEYDEQSVILDSIAGYVHAQMINWDYTDSTLKAGVSDKVTGFLKGRIGLIYFNEDRDDLFGMDLFYETGLTGLNGNPLYNGNISGVKWQAAHNTGIRGYGFTYDNLNRITNAEYGLYTENGWDDENRYGISIDNYDFNGNIKHLLRSGLSDYNEGIPPEFGVMDDLTYEYEGNRLLKVDDNAPGNFGFEGNDFRDNGSMAETEYLYDDNGNMIKDINKKIANVEYNLLNLPESIVYENAYEISYIYTADGQKLTKIVNDGTNPEIRTDYTGRFVYNNDELEYFLMEEGRMVEVEGISGQYRPEYFLCDHLGDVRVVFSDTDEDGTPEILQENHYYPFGLTMGSLNYVNNTENKLKYNGKELDDENNLRWYDYGFRRYDPQLGRWHVMDALSEKYINLSPYAYVANNPFRFIDPFGLSMYDPFGGEGGAGPTGNFFGKNTYEPSYYVTDIEEGLQFRGDPTEIKYEVRNGKVYRVTYDMLTGREISAVYISDVKKEKEKNEEDDKEDKDKDEQKEDAQSDGGDEIKPSFKEPSQMYIISENLKGRTVYVSDGKGNYKYYYPDGSIEISTTSPVMKMLQDITLLLTPELKGLQFVKAPVMNFLKSPVRNLTGKPLRAFLRWEKHTLPGVGNIRHINIGGKGSGLPFNLHIHKYNWYKPWRW